MNKKKVITIVVILAIVGLAVFFPIKKVIETNRAIAAAYEQGLAYMEAGQWLQAYQTLDSYELRVYKDSRNLSQYCNARLVFESGDTLRAKVILMGIDTTTMSHQEDIAQLRQQIEDDMPAYRERMKQKLQEKKAAARKGVPYVRMPEEWISITTLGSPDEHFSETRVEGLGEHKEELYRFKNSSGQIIFTARCAHGFVISVSDSRDAPWGGKSYTSKYSSDPYSASDYSDPDDFYYDHYDDFFDYEDAENYFYEHGG